MPRLILIDNYSGYVFGDTADYASFVAAGEMTPLWAARLLDESIGEPGRVYEEYGPNHRPAENDSAYHVYRADVNGSEAVPVVTDGQDQEMIRAVVENCRKVAVVSFGRYLD